MEGKPEAEDDAMILSLLSAQVTLERKELPSDRGRALKKGKSILMTLFLSIIRAQRG